MPTTDEYTVYVTMGDETETDNFQVYSSLMFFFLNFWWLILLISIIVVVAAVFVIGYGKQKSRKDEYVGEAPYQEEQQYTMEEPDEEKEIDVNLPSEEDF